MKRSLAMAVALLFASATAFAFHCPKDMKEIDDALAKKPKLTEAQMSEVTKLRAEGEVAEPRYREPGDALQRGGVGVDRGEGGAAVSAGQAARRVGEDVQFE